MKLVCIALIGAALSTTAFAKWETVWKKTQEGDSPSSILHVLNQVNGAYDFLVKQEVKRRVAGLPADKLKSIVYTIKMDKWVGPESTCTVDDPRQYEAIESGGFTWNEGGSFLFANRHEYMGEDWNPCYFEMKAEQRRMPEPKPLTFTAR